MILLLHSTFVVYADLKTAFADYTETHDKTSLSKQSHRVPFLLLLYLKFRVFFIFKNVPRYGVLFLDET